MEFANTFLVQAPIAQVWALLLDVERTAPCMPGAQVLEQTAERAYKVAVKVKVGPMTMNYKGDVEIVEEDEASHRALMRAKAKEARGQGTASADIQMFLREQHGGTEAAIVTTMQMSGKAAAMGQGVIKDVAAALTRTFAQNLQALVEGEGGGPPSAGATPSAGVTPGVDPVPVVEDLAPAVDAPAPVHEDPSAGTGDEMPTAEHPVPPVTGDAPPAAEDSVTPVAGDAPPAAHALPDHDAAPAAERPAPATAPEPSAFSSPRPTTTEPEPVEVSLPVGQIAVAVVKGRLKDPKTLGVIAVLLVLMKILRRRRD